MPESSDFELFNAPAASEKKEVNQEAFNEEMRRTQKAMKDLQQEEGKAKDNDNNLAQIIVQFLGQEGNTDLFLLISRAVAQNITSEFIIAILSLIDQRSYDETKGLLAAGQTEKAPANDEKHQHQKAEFESLTDEQKRAIDHWVKNMSMVAHKKPHRLHDCLVMKGQQERVISPVAIQLASFILRRYFNYYQIEVDFQNIRDFIEGVFVGIINSLEELMKGQRQLEG